MIGNTGKKDGSQHRKNARRDMYKKPRCVSRVLFGKQMGAGQNQQKSLYAAIGQVADIRNDISCW